MKVDFGFALYLPYQDAIFASLREVAKDLKNGFNSRPNVNVSGHSGGLRFDATKPQAFA
jgi:hypothetical protein